MLEQVSRALEVMVVYSPLGAGKNLLRGTLWCEFAVPGLVSGLVPERRLACCKRGCSISRVSLICACGSFWPITGADIAVALWRLAGRSPDER